MALFLLDCILKAVSCKWARCLAYQMGFANRARNDMLANQSAAGLWLVMPAEACWQADKYIWWN